MAAGGVDVARRRDDHYSKKESHHLRNSYRDAGLNRGTEHSISYRNGYVSYAGTIKTGYGRDGDGRGRGLVGRSRDWELGEFSGGGRDNDAFASKSRAVDDDISKFEDRVSMPPEKKRKFSPIVWDKDDKEVRISSRNRIIPKSTPLCSPTESIGKLANDCTEDGDDAMEPATNAYPPASVSLAAGSVPLANSPTVLAPEKCGKSNNEQGMVEEDEYIEVRHVATSRWAHEEDSPGRSCSDNAGDTPTGTRGLRLMDSTDAAESGEFCGGFEGSRGNSSSSVGQGSFGEGGYSKRELENDNFMDIDEMHDEAADVSNLELELEDYEDSSEFPEPAGPKPRSKNMLQGCRSVFEYEKLRKINEGTYGVVYKARDKKTDEIMALKKVKMGIERDGFPLSLLREINILLSLHHPSVVEVKEVVMDDNRGDVFMVMEYMEHDLKGLVDMMKQPFSEKEVKCLMLQLLEGVKYLHDNWVLHRDLKTSNLLVNNNSKLKICDFGLSRQYGSPLKPYTPLVVTLWYRAPELLLGTKQYSTAIDMWSVGCIMAELLAKQPLFDGKTEFEQLDKIFGVLGTPSEAIWPGFSELPGAKVKFVKHSRNTLREKFPAISFKGSPVLSDQGFDFLSQLLTFNPDERITAEAALRHRWFHMDSEQELISIQESLAKKLKSMTKV